MVYEIERTDEFTEWWEGLSQKEQIEVAKIVGLLVEKGPDLKRPYAGKIEGSKKIPNLKELIIQFAGDPYRVFFMFDERRHSFAWCKKVRRQKGRSRMVQGKNRRS
jgi:hypothetical protein